MGMGSTCGGSNIPESEYCDQAEVTTPTTLEIGRGLDDAFVPFSDGDVAEIVTGGQGTDMTPIRLRAGGGRACVEQSTRVLGPNGVVIGSEGVALRFHEQGDGSFVTNDIWVQLGNWTRVNGSWATIETTIGERTSSRQVWLGEAYDGPDLAFPAEPVTASVNADSIPVPLAMSFAPTESFLAYIAVADETVAASGEGFQSFYPDGSTAATMYLYPVGPGTTEVTVYFGQDAVTGTVTVE